MRGCGMWCENLTSRKVSSKLSQGAQYCCINKWEITFIWEITYGSRLLLMISPITCAVWHFFFIFLKQHQALHDHQTSISIVGKPICNPLFADIDLIEDTNRTERCERLTDILNSCGNGKAEIHMSGVQLEELNYFEYLDHDSSSGKVYGLVMWPGKTPSWQLSFKEP